MIHTDKKVLDACCGGKMFWFDKKDDRVLYIDNRKVVPHKLSNGSLFSVEPDLLMDFRALEFADETFALIVFDPPHVARAGEASFLANKYGFLNKETWRDDLRAGFSECWRVLKPQGTLIFKWNECHIPLREILELTPARPLFGNRGGALV